MKLSDLAKRMIWTILIIGFVFIIGSVIYYRSLDFLPFFFGVSLGSVVSIVKVFLLDNTVNKALSMDKTGAGKYVSLQYFIRFFLTGVVLYIGAVVPDINLWGVAAGVIAFQLATYGIKFANK
ncbi:MAG: ATP synthase subunit I [Clostridia bacterium]|jgi:hypothetical protein|nr:hypothetical protein [Clostridiaceae bacterium]